MSYLEEPTSLKETIDKVADAAGVHRGPLAVRVELLAGKLRDVQLEIERLRGLLAARSADLRAPDDRA